ITTATVQLEDAINQTEEIETLLKSAWLNVFDEPTIGSLQHQISALSTAMDGAYYRVHTDVPHPKVNNAQATPNLDLPSQSIQAITYSLEYWKRAVKKICGVQAQSSRSMNVVPQTQQPATTSQTKAQNNGLPGTQQGGKTHSSAIQKM